MGSAQSSLLLVLTTLFLVQAGSAQQSGMQWPPAGDAVVRVRFGPFQRTTPAGSQQFFTVEATSENVAQRTIQRLELHVRLLDKEGVRIGESTLVLRDVEPGQVVRSLLHVNTVGQPVTVELAGPTSVAGIFASPGGKVVPIRIESVPIGATLRVNGEEAGLTPRVVRLPPGDHVLEFHKEGFRTATHHLEVEPDEAPGGVISVELGGLMQDTLQLRDGRVLLGDVESVSTTHVEVRVEGKTHSLSRNEVRKIIFVEREFSEE